MKNNGFTLIELLIVIAIAAVLVIALSFEFIGWQGRYKVESQTKNLYSDLMNARLKAMQRNRAHFVVVTTNDYSIFEDTNENGAYDAGTDNDMVQFSNPKPLEYPSLWAGTVTMDTRGLAFPDNIIPNDAIVLDKGSNDPDYDCIILFTTRINIGKYDDVANCDAK